MIEDHSDDFATSTDDRTERDRQEPGRTTLGRTARLALTLGFGLLAIASIAAGAYFIQKLDRLDGQLDARSDVVRVAERFAVQFNTYEPDSMDDYAESLNSMLTTSARTKFQSVMDETVSAMQEAELKSEGRLLASGVAHVDRDDAKVLVVADAEADSVFGPRQRHFRWEISLDKVDGEWLVDDFAPVQ